MARYAVVVTETTTYTIDIDADDTKQAESKVDDLYINNDANPEQAGFEYVKGERETFARKL